MSVTLGLDRDLSLESLTSRSSYFLDVACEIPSPEALPRRCKRRTNAPCGVAGQLEVR
jgi:hypothetical protein